MQLLETAHTAVLHRVLETSGKVRNELGNRSRQYVSFKDALSYRLSFAVFNLPSVSNGTSDTLSNQDTIAFREVTSSTGVALLAVLTAITSLLILHSINRAHTAVGLDQLSFARDEGSTRRLGCTSQQATHHDGGSTESKTLGNVANVLDTAISNARNAKASSEATDCVNSSCLGSANGHDLLGDAGRATSHANSKTVNASSNEASSLLSGNNISTDNIQIRELSLGPLDHLNLVHAVALRAIKDNNVETSVDQLLQTDLVLRAGANGSSAEKLFAVGKLRSQREVLVLGQVRARNHGNQVEVLVDNGELALLGLGQDFVRLGQGNAIGSSDEVVDHDLGDRCSVVIFELDVSVGDNTKEL